MGACACLPKSGCILKIIPPPVRPPDPGRAAEEMKKNPLGAIVNPLGVFNPTGIPQIGDVVEFAIKNPNQVIGMLQDPGRVIYTPVAAAMISGRNAVVANGGQPIPDRIKFFLLRWHTPELLNSVRWTSNWGPLNNTFQGAQMYFNARTNAITLINAVVFRDEASANDPALWAHEMVHVEQYRNWGVTDFARTWVGNSSEGGPVEAPAYARGAEAENVVATEAMPSDQIKSQKFPSGFMLGPCGCWGAVNANAVIPAPFCLSGFEGPVACGPTGLCGGGAPWARTCR